jgi:hypothetical protein
MLLDAPAGDAAPAAPWRRLKLGRIAAYASLAALVAIVSGLILQTLTDTGVRDLAQQEAPTRVNKGPVVAAREPEPDARRADALAKQGDADKADDAVAGLKARDAKDAALMPDSESERIGGLAFTERKLEDAINGAAPTPPPAASNAEASLDQLAQGTTDKRDETLAGETRGGTGAGGARGREQFGAKETTAPEPSPSTGTDAPAPAAAPTPPPTLEEMRQRMETRVDEFDAAQGDRDTAPSPAEMMKRSEPPADRVAEESGAARPKLAFTRKDVPTPGAGNGLKLAAADLALEVTAADPSEATTDVIIWAAQNRVRVASEIQRSVQIESVPQNDGKTRELRLVETPGQQDRSRVTLVLNGRQISELLAHLNRPQARTNATLTQQVPAASLMSARLKATETVEAQTQPATRPAPPEGSAAAAAATGVSADEAEFRTIPVPMTEVAKSIPDEAEVQLPIVIRAAEDANQSPE